MIENSSQTVQEISDDKEIKNSPTEENISETTKDEELTFDPKDVPSADYS